MHKTVLLTLLVTFFFDEIYGIPSARILGGDEVAPHSLPYQVGLFIPVRSGGQIFCGASIIAPQTVLTSANCFKNNNGPVEVVLGAHDVLSYETSQVRVNSSDIIVHEEFDGTPLYDIAIVRLPEPIKYNAYIRPVRLPRNNSTDYEGAEALVSGWGWVSDYVRHLAPALRALEVSIVSNFGCEVTYFLGIGGNNLCVTGRSTCVSDSGGPLVIDGVQVGIVSLRNVLMCEEGWPSAYVRVAGYLEWIRSNLL